MKKKTSDKNKQKTHRFKLNNGLEVVIVPIGKAPIVNITMAYKVGSKDEKPGKTGFAHLFEHLMFEGTKNVAKGGFDEYCSMAGGTNNAYTSYDLTSYTMTLPAHQVEMGLWLESDRMFNFEVTPEALKNQKDVVTEEISQTVDNQPYGKWRELLAASAFSSESSYSWEVHGSKEDVAASVIEDVKEFHKMFYRPDNACLTISGSVDIDIVKNLIDKYFNISIDYKNKPKRNLHLPEYCQKGSYSSFKDNIPFNAVFAAFHCDGFLSENIYKADIISNMLGDGKSSAIYNELVYNRQIASAAGSFMDKREHNSLLTFFAIGANENVSNDELFNGLMDIFEKIIQNGPDTDVFLKSRNQISTFIAYDLQYLGGLGDLISSRTLFFDDPESSFNLIDNYLNITIDDLKQYLKNFKGRNEAIRIDATPVCNDKTN